MSHIAPDHRGHKKLLVILKKECEKRSLTLVPVPHYSLIPEKLTEKYINNFSRECLFIRSLPDVLILGHPYYSLFVDAKDSYRKSTNNIAIELSCFYNNTLRKQLLKLWSTYMCFYNNKPYFVIFPNGPDIIMIPQYWDNKLSKNVYLSQRSKLEQIYKKDIPIIQHTKPIVPGAIEDPFTLTKWENLKHFDIGLILDKLVEQNKHKNIFKGVV